MRETDGVMSFASTQAQRRAGTRGETDTDMTPPLPPQAEKGKGSRASKQDPEEDTCPDTDSGEHHSMTSARRPQRYQDVFQPYKEAHKTMSDARRILHSSGGEASSLVPSLPPLFVFPSPSFLLLPFPPPSPAGQSS